MLFLTVTCAFCIGVQLTSKETVGRVAMFDAMDDDCRRFLSRYLKPLLLMPREVRWIWLNGFDRVDWPKTDLKFGESHADLDSMQSFIL